jgi:ribonuclease HI
MSQEHHGPTDDIVIYMDDSCTKNGETTAKAGFGMWFNQDNSRNTGLPVANTYNQSNNAAKILAINHALSITPLSANVHIKTDSKWSINTLGPNLEKNEDMDYVRDVIMELSGGVPEVC